MGVHSFWGSPGTPRRVRSQLGPRKIQKIMLAIRQCQRWFSFPKALWRDGEFLKRVVSPGSAFVLGLRWKYHQTNGRHHYKQPQLSHTSWRKKLSSLLIPSGWVMTELSGCFWMVIWGWGTFDSKWKKNQVGVSRRLRCLKYNLVNAPWVWFSIIVWRNSFFSFSLSICWGQRGWGGGGGGERVIFPFSLDLQNFLFQNDLCSTFFLCCKETTFLVKVPKLFLGMIPA